MSIKRFVANKDTTITDAYQENLRKRGTDSNMGEADSLEMFSLYGQVGSSSLERSRILVQFPVEDMATDRTAGRIPSSGSVQFYLKLFNVKHPFSVPRKFYATINPVSKFWEEGYGLDMESYADYGFRPTIGGYGATWLYAANSSSWNSAGGEYLTGSGYDLNCYFETGLEDLELDITNLVEEWMTGTLDNNGLLVKLSSSQENCEGLQSFYTKKFSARGSEFYLNRPCIEARWNPSITDDRNNFYSSSSLLSAADNTMNLYFYNRVNGSLKNIVGNPTPSITFYSTYSNGTFTNPVSASSSITNPLPGVYKAEVSINTTASVLWDVWTIQSSSCFSGSFDVLQRETDPVSTSTEYVCNITNLKAVYSQQEKVRLSIFVRERNWQPNIYTVAYSNVENTAIPNLYYKIFRLNDNYTIVDYSTGSLAYSKTSYDSNGNYFELDMNIFEKDYGYGVKLATWDGQQLSEFKDIYKFRIE